MIKYFRINKTALNDVEFCQTWMVPEGTKMLSFRMAEGTLMGDDYPVDARIDMSIRHPGKVLSDFISNPNSIFPVSKRMKEIIESLADNEIEYLPFSLYNHKGRLASDDYFIINIIGSFDCLNLQESDITWSKSHPGEIVDIDEFALDAEKVKDAPHIFRIKEDPCEYVVSEILANAFKAANLTNINLEELEVK